MTSAHSRDLFATRAIHAGNQGDPLTGAVMTPIHVSSTYRQDSPGRHRGFEYGRTHNPTRFAFERCAADLESGSDGFAFASGLAAMTTVLELLPAGSHIVAGDDLYGGTWRLFERVKKPSSGLDITYVDPTDTAAVASAIRPDTRLLWIETPSNPLLKLADLRALAALAHQRGILAVADNTFATPVGQRPLELGFDLVVHSITKYLNGHSDVIGGLVVTARADLAERLRFLQNATGAVLGPFDSFLALRGLKTLPLRMERHAANALALARWLETHPVVERVIYPGLRSHPQHALARRQMSNHGGMVTVVVKGGLRKSRRLLERLRLFACAESLGGVESLAEHPALMTHASLPKERRTALGIVDGLVRLSVGLEDLTDLRADLEQALG